MEYNLSYPPTDAPPAFVYQDQPALTSASILINYEAERAALGSILIDPEQYYTVEARITKEDLGREAHQWLFCAFQELADRRTPIDFVTVTDLLDQKGQLQQIGGPAFITDLIAQIPTSLYADHYAQIVADYAERRRIIAVGGKMAKLAYDLTMPIEDVRSAMDRAVSDLARQEKNTLIPIGNKLQEVIERIDFLSRNKGILLGVPTGFTMLDRVLRGLQRGNFIIVGGRPGMGKTTFCLDIGYRAASKYGLRVALFSLEMTSEEITQKIIAAQTGIDSTRLRTGEVGEDEWPLILSESNQIAKAPFLIDDTPGVSVAEIRSKARRMARTDGLDMILLDHIQLMHGGSPAAVRNEMTNRQQEISYISRSLKLLARELNVPVVAISQLSRAVESRSDKRPILSDFREAGSLEQDCDVGMFLYRDDYYNPESERQNIAEVIVAKHRNGSTGTVNLYFCKEISAFRDLEIQRTELDY